MTTALSGTLVRTPEGWQWCDGTPEPRVRDLTASEFYNFRCRRDGTKQTYVEVPLSIAHRENELRWITDGVVAGKYRQCISGDHTGPLTLTDEGVQRMRIEPGEDPLLGNEPIIHRRAIPRVALVPIEEWDAWSRSTPLGVSWDHCDEADILRLSETLRGGK